MIFFLIRNLLLYFRDKTTVLLSFLAEFIILGLYFLFIRNNLLEQCHGIMNISYVLDIWMISGLLGITSVTTTMGVYSRMVEDKHNSIQKDLITSPLNYTQLLSGYMLSAIAIGLLMTIILFLVSACYIELRYHLPLCSGNGFSLFLIMILTTIANSSLVLFFVSLLKSNTALASLATIVGALIGFLTGIYLPMGSVPTFVQRLVTCFPVSHSVLLYRQILLDWPLSNAFSNQSSDSLLQFKDWMGIRFQFLGCFLTRSTSIAILVVTFFVFTVITLYHFSHHGKFGAS